MEKRHQHAEQSHAGLKFSIRNGMSEHNWTWKAFNDSGGNEYDSLLLQTKSQRIIKTTERSICPRPIVRKIQKSRIHMLPYNTTRLQHFRDDDNLKRIVFAQWSTFKISIYVNVLRCIFVFDECLSRVRICEQSEYAHLRNGNPKRDTSVCRVL